MCIIIYICIIIYRWLQIRLQCIGAFIVLFVSLLAVIGRDTLSAGVVGLIITNALHITGTLQWVVRVTSEVENNTVSVEKNPRIHRNTY